MSERKCDDIIDTYLEYVKDTESPLSYHLWTIIAVIGAACGHNYMQGEVVFDMGNNIYVLLIAKQGKTRKTSALEIGMALLAEVEEVAVSPESASKEAMFKQMSESTNGHGESNYVAYTGELSAILNTSGIDMANFLIRVFDATNKLENLTLARQTETIAKPHITFLSATTPAYMRDGFSGLDMRENGLVSRMAIVFEEKPAQRKPFGAKKDKEIKQKLIHDLRLLAAETPRRPITYEPSAKEFYANWYIETLATAENTATNPLEEAFISRKDIFVHKVSAICAISRNSPVVEQRDIDRAFSIIDPMQAGLQEVYGLLGTDKNLHVKEAAMKVIRSKGKIARADLTAMFMREVNRTEWLDILNHLAEAGMIILDEHGWVRWVNDRK